MNNLPAPVEPQLALTRLGFVELPILIRTAGEGAARRFLEFFTANIRNRNTREAYARACGRFLAWTEARGLTHLRQVEPMLVAAYVEQLQLEMAAPSVKQHLAAIRMLFDWLVTGQVVPVNPAASVRGPTHVVKRGKTPVLTADHARKLLDSLQVADKDGKPDVVGLRDRALIAVMVYSFARVGAAVRMRVEDYYQDGKRFWLRLHEKGGKLHQVPAHHNAEAYLDAYLEAAGIADHEKTPLFRSATKAGTLTDHAMTRNDAFRMVKRRVKALNEAAPNKEHLLPRTTCHSFRVCGITTYLENGGTLENAQAIANHSSPRTTKLYDRTSDEITLDEVERIRI